MAKKIKKLEGQSLVDKYSEDQTLQNNLRRLMKMHEESQEDVAKVVGCSRASMGNYLNGTMPNAAILQCLADHYKVSVDSLLGRSKVETEEDTEFLLKCSEYTGLTIDAIKDLRIRPGRAYTISNICATKNNLIESIGEYLFPKTEKLYDDVDAEILEIDEEGIYQPILSLQDVDNKNYVLVSPQGDFILDSGTFGSVKLVEISSILISMKLQQGKDNK